MSPKFPQRKLGRDLVSSIGLGCMGMSNPLSTTTSTSEDEHLQVLSAAVDMVINFWVTSNSYGPFTNENSSGDGPAKMTMDVDGRPEYVKEVCEASLERLGTDYIDLCYQHRVDPNTPIEKTVEAMAQLKREGEIRYLELSECSAQKLRRAHKVHPITAAEMQFSPFALDIEADQKKFLETARELGVAIVAYSPLGRGFLTGAFMSRDDFDKMKMRIIHPRLSEENFAGNMKLVDAFAAIAIEKGCTPDQLALAWVLAQGEDFIPIPGTKHIKYLKENAAAVNGEFSREDDEKIRKIIESVGGSKGARYSEATMSTLFGDSPEL